MTEQKIFFPLKRLQISGAVGPLLCGFLMLVISALFLMSGVSEVFIICFIVFASIYIVTIILQIFRRKIILTHDEIIDVWGGFGQKQTVLRRNVQDCTIQVVRPVLAFFSIEGESETLTLHSKNNTDIWRINIGFFKQQDKEDIVRLLCGKNYNSLQKTGSWV